MRRSARPALVGLVLVGVLLGTAVSATADSPHDVDFTADADSGIWPYGYPDTATYGQTITVPAGVATIETFSFVMDVPAGLVFRGAVQAWDGEKATGPVLYLSDPTSTAGDGYELVTFNPDVAVTPGVYVLYATISYDFGANAGAGSGDWASITSGPYEDGEMVWDNNGGDIDQLTTTRWDNPGNAYTEDMAFAVTFGLPVAPPDPADPATPVTGNPAFTG